MWIKLILILIVFYWIGKTVGNLMRAIRQDTAAPLVPPRETYQPPPPRQRSAPARPDPREKDIEDARWVDL